MPLYRNLPDNFKKLRKRIIITIAPIFLVIAIAVLLIRNNAEKNAQNDISTWLLVITVVAGILLYSIFKAIKQQKIIYDSYRLTVENDYIKQERKGVSSITLFFAEIKEVTKDNTGNLTLSGDKSTSKIVISPFIENYDELENLMRLRFDILPSGTQTLYQKFPFVIPLITVVLFVVVYASTNKILVLVSGMIIMILLIWSFYKIRTSPQIDRTIKSKAWWMLFVLASIIAIVYFKVFVN